MTEFYVKVIPGQDEFHIDVSGTYPKISVTAPASQGRANDELVNKLSTVIGDDVGIISGHHSRRKKIATSADRQTVENKLEKHSP